MKLQRINLHWYCFLKRPNHWRFHLSGVLREIEPRLWLETAGYTALAALVQWYLHFVRS
jgi:hypothetical protein